MSKEFRRKEANKINNKSAVILCIQWILILIIIFCSVKIIIWFISSKEDSKKNTILSDQVVKIYTNTNNIDIYEPQVKEETKVYIDFDKLAEINSDIVGWIIIDGTNINYPILHAGDNDFYLHRNYLKEYSQSGSIFLDYENNSLDESNIILYGHNMSDGLMFHQLSKIYNFELGDNIDVKIITKTETKIYSVFSTYMISPDEFENMSNFDEVISKSIINFKYNSIDKSKILTLYTCNSIGDKRIIVHAALSNTIVNN